MAEKREGYYTAEGVDVEVRIDGGATKFIVDRKAAEKYAHERRSYKYEIFSTGSSGSRNLIGYGIPK